MKNYNKSQIEQFVIDKIREKRIEKGISQSELANLLDVSIGFIGNVENPKYRAKYNLNHINDIAHILECSPKDFLPETPFINKKERIDKDLDE